MAAHSQWRLDWNGNTVRACGAGEDEVLAGAWQGLVVLEWSVTGRFGMGSSSGRVAESLVSRVKVLGFVSRNI